MASLTGMFTGNPFLPHGVCLLWDTNLVWLHVVSDALIALAYYTIPFLLIYFIRKRQDLKFHGMFWLFGGFIFACGTTHVMGIWTLWQPIYQLEGVIKFLTAVASVATAVLLVPLIPRALLLPSRADLEVANVTLQQQIRARARAEQLLHQAYEELERRVEERTADLARANAALQEEIGLRQRAEDASRRLNAELERRVIERTTQLQASETRFRGLLESAPDAMVITDSDGRIVLANHQAEALFRYAQEELIGHPVELLIPERFHGRHSEHRARYTAAPSSRPMGMGLELYARRRDGQEFPVEISLSLLAADEGLLISTAVRDITARKQAEDQLKSQAALLDLTHDSIIVRDLKDRIVFWNAGAERRYGWTKAEAHGEDIHSLLRTQFPSPREEVQAALWHDRQWEGDVIHRTRNGRQLVVASRWVMQCDPHGQPTAILEINNDITERHQTEEARALLAAVVESSNDAIIGGTLEGTIVSWNTAAERLYGYTPAEAIGQSFARLLSPPDFREGLRLLLEQIKRGQPIESFETVWLRKDGQPIDVALTISPIQYATGNITGASVTARDITARKRVEEQLQESEERFRTLTSLSPVGIFWSDARGNTLFVNEHWCTMTGMTAEEARGWGWMQAVHLEDRERLMQEWGLVVRTEQAFTSEYRYQTPAGDIIWAYGRAVALRNSAGSVTGYLGTVTDITPLKRVEEDLRRTTVELARSNAELEQFAYIASHDLQEPLRAVAGCVQLLRRRYRDALDAGADELITHAVDGTIRMQALINDLLDFARVTTQGKPFEPTDCNAMLQRALADLQVAIQESEAIVTYDPLPTVIADPGQLVRVFQNLLSNALKYRQAQPPEVHIGVEHLVRECQFAVHDHGIGIEPEYFERIFGIFQRLHTRREYPGTGIGLALCRKIVERHNGRIWVASEPGKGSTFFFTLPDRR